MSEEVRVTSSTGGQKGSKIERFDLLPVEALEELARIYEFGSRKYADHNYRKGYDWSLSYASLQRHANLWWKGEDLDEESGLSHIMHAAWHCFALYMFLLEHPEFDDRLSTIRAKQAGKKPDHQVELEQQIAELQSKIFELEDDKSSLEADIRTHELEKKPSEQFKDLGDPWGLGHIFDVKLAGDEVVYERPDQHKEKIVKYGVPDKFYSAYTPAVIKDGRDICCHNCKFSCVAARDDAE